MYEQDFYNIWKFDPLVDKSCIYPWNGPTASSPVSHFYPRTRREIFKKQPWGKTVQNVPGGGVKID